MEQQEQKFSFSESFNKSKAYIETQVELAKLRAISRASRIIGSLIVDASKVLLGLLIVFFLSMALGFYLGEVLGSNSLGFLATGGVFILVVFLIRVLEPNIETAFTNITIKKVMAKWGDEDDENQEEVSPSSDPGVGGESDEVPLTEQENSEQSSPVEHNEQARV